MGNPENDRTLPLSRGPNETQEFKAPEEEVPELELVEVEPAVLLETLEQVQQREIAVIERALRGKTLTSESLVCDFVRVNPVSVTVEVKDRKTGVTLKLGRAEMEGFKVQERS
jgi:hypothetical protein